MTSGQQRAVRELRRLAIANPDGFAFDDPVVAASGWFRTTISLRLGRMPTCAGGLRLREREDFVLLVPPDFPFERPALRVTHRRFAGFPHVIWGTGICLYRSNLHWNPADGLFGFFDQLHEWLRRAALNDMDPVDLPVEPPHHVTSFSELPFVVRANAPVPAGESWIGLAEITKYANRFELIGWHDPSSTWPEHARLALAIILPSSLPLEFPRMGSEFFAELEKQGFDPNRVIRNLALAALFTDENEPIHLVLGIPMRRAADGSPRLHIAVWTTPAARTKSLRLVLPKDADSAELSTLRMELLDTLRDVFNHTEIVWCRVLEDRSELVVRRDTETASSWLLGKKVLILGCGALGSWMAECVARSGASLIRLVDDSIVKPGLLVRQNYRAGDIGSAKSVALRERITAIDTRITVDALEGDAFGFATADPTWLSQCDIILDCTASAIFQMKIERDWRRWKPAPATFVSFALDAKARHCLVAGVSRSSDGGPWDAFMQLKRVISVEGRSVTAANAFYDPAAADQLLQPEPGCSDATFSGSASDVMALASSALNWTLSVVIGTTERFGAVISTSRPEIHETLATFELSELIEVQVGEYRVRVAPAVFRSARAWARKSGRMRSLFDETGGLLWGFWDDAVKVVWVWDASGPPADSSHDEGYFVCGIDGTTAEHARRMQISRGSCGFVGLWHTHPDMLPKQSGTDIIGMSTLVAGTFENHRRALMMIFGRRDGQPMAGFYIYESDDVTGAREQISATSNHIPLKTPVV